MKRLFSGRQVTKQRAPELSQSKSRVATSSERIKSVGQLEALERYAQHQNQKVIHSADAFDRNFALTDDDHLLDGMLKTQGQFLVSSDFCVYTSVTDHKLITKVTKRVATLKGIKSDDVIVLPCAPSVTKMVFKEHFDALEGEESDNQEKSSDRTDSQTLLDSLIQAGVDADATDIHITMSRTKARVQMRIHGLLREFQNPFNASGTWKLKDLESVCSTAVNAEAAKKSGVSEHFSMTKPIDATFSIRLSSTGEHREIRYAQTPNNIGGIKAVFRILADQNNSDEAEANSSDSLMDMGYLPEQAVLIEEMAATSSGLVIVAGPTGSGKTTTLSTVMNTVPKELSCYTYEDPCETVIASATQVPVKVGSESMDWKNLSKNSLRLDPDVIMYGELRDSHVAHEVVHAATTGHLVMTTLHTNSAIGCVTRLFDLDISYSRMSEPGFLKLLVFQRLLPKVCTSCCFDASTFTTDSKVKQRQFERLNRHFSPQRGAIRFANTREDNDCEVCSGSGVNGRALVAEVISIDSLARSFIEKGATASWEKSLRERGWIGIMDHAEILVYDGTVCPIIAESKLSEFFGDGGENSEAFDYRLFRNELQSQAQGPALAVAESGA